TYSHSAPLVTRMVQSRSPVPFFSRPRLRLAIVSSSWWVYGAEREKTMGRSIWVIIAFLWIGAQARAEALTYPDAERLALKLSGQFLPPPALLNRLQTDLSAIRAANPATRSLVAVEPWFPGLINVQLTPSAYTQWQQGTYHGFDSLFAQYGQPEIE